KIYTAIETVMVGAQIVPYRELLRRQDSATKPLVLHRVERAIRGLQCSKVCLVRRPERALACRLANGDTVKDLRPLAVLGRLFDVVPPDDQVVVWRDRLASRHCSDAGVGFINLASQRDLETWLSEFDPLYGGDHSNCGLLARCLA